jgi:glutaminase
MQARAVDYQALLEEIRNGVRPHFGKGRVADYIPARAAVPPSKFGVAIQTVDGRSFASGDAREPFSIQSIS